MSRKMRFFKKVLNECETDIGPKWKRLAVNEVVFRESVIVTFWGFFFQSACTMVKVESES